MNLSLSDWDLLHQNGAAFLMPILAAATATPAPATPANQGFSWDSILHTLRSSSAGWFDLIVVIAILLGIIRGRKLGMSGILLGMFQWVSIVAMAAWLYAPAGQFCHESTGLGMLLCNVLSYLGIAVLVRLIFVWLQRSVGQKLVGSDTFGVGEFYLGMLAGIVEFFCIVIFFIALLNARLYSAAEWKDLAKKEKEKYAITAPSLMTVQSDIFTNSFSGRLARKHLDILFITPTLPQSNSPGIKTRRENDLRDVMGR